MNSCCAIHGSSSSRSKEFSRAWSLGTVVAILGLGLPRVLFNAGSRETEDSRVSKSNPAYYTYSTMEKRLQKWACHTVVWQWLDFPRSQPNWRLVSNRLPSP